MIKHSNELNKIKTKITSIQYCLECCNCVKNLYLLEHSRYKIRKPYNNPAMNKITSQNTDNKILTDLDLMLLRERECFK